MIDLPSTPTSLYNWEMDVVGYYNEIIHLVCGVKAKSQPFITWFKRRDGNFLEVKHDSENYTCVENCQKLDVIINEYTIGDYKCRGCNEYGCGESFLLMVSLLRKFFLMIECCEIMNKFRR